MKILIAESDPSVAADLASRLVGLGYEVAGVATSAREAVALAAQVEPQLVLVDTALGGDTEAVEVAREICRRQPVPILYTIPDTDEVSARRVQSYGPSGYLLKPFAERELRVALAMARERGGASGSAGELEARFFDLSIDLLCYLGFDGRFARLNPAWERVLGFTREELMSRPFIEFVHPEDRERTLRQNREVRGGGQAHGFENRYLCKDGSYRWLLWNAAPDIARNTIYSVARDITERKRMETELERLSTTDELTGLWNRRGFSTLAEQELKRARRTASYVLLFYIDLDRFKEVNDVYGHTEGDRVLVDAARLLQESCRGSDVVARLGGDEFAILALDGTGEGEHIIPERISEALGRLNEAHAHPYVVGLTLGVVRLRPGEEMDLAALLTRADQRMYSAKRAKRAGS